MYIVKISKSYITIGFKFKNFMDAGAFLEAALDHSEQDLDVQIVKQEEEKTEEA